MATANITTNSTESSAELYDLLQLSQELQPVKISELRNRSLAEFAKAMDNASLLLMHFDEYLRSRAEIRFRKQIQEATFACVRLMDDGNEVKVGNLCWNLEDTEEAQRFIARYVDLVGRAKKLWALTMPEHAQFLMNLTSDEN